MQCNFKWLSVGPSACLSPCLSACLFACLSVSWWACLFSMLLICWMESHCCACEYIYVCVRVRVSKCGSSYLYSLGEHEIRLMTLCSTRTYNKILMKYFIYVYQAAWLEGNFICQLSVVYDNVGTVDGNGDGINDFLV